MAQVLIRRTGCSAALAVLYVAVVQLLLSAGKIDFAVRVDCTAAHRLPIAEVRLNPRIPLPVQYHPYPL